jgi:transcriptional regulator with XRE-family HTH domain
LAQARQKAGLSVRDASRKSEISSGNISGIETGRYLPSAKALIILSQLYNVSIDWILKGYEAFYNKDIMRDVFENLLKDKQEWVLIEAIAALSKKDTVQFNFQSYMTEQDDPIIKEMIKYLKTTWDSGDEKTRNWLEIQFQQCFPKYKDKSKEQEN